MKLFDFIEMTQKVDNNVKNIIINNFTCDSNITLAKNRDCKFDIEMISEKYLKSNIKEFWLGNEKVEVYLQ